MAGEVREVAMPGSTATPEHTMSPEGAARLAALSPEQLVAQELAPPAKTDPEQAEALKPEDQPDPQAERVTPRQEVDVTSIEPLAVSDGYRADAEGYRQDAATIAREHNIPASEMSALYEFVGSAAAAELASAATDASSFQGQTPGPDLANPDACRQIIRTKYGAMGDALMEAARKEFHALPKDVQAWLEHDHGDGRKLANHPALVAGLALRPFARLSQDAARAELDRIRQSADYVQGNPLAVQKARMLNIVLAGKGTAEKKSSGQFLTRTPKPAPSARESIQKNIDGLRRSPAYFDKGHAAHAETVRQVHALYAQLYPEASR